MIAADGGPVSFPTLYERIGNQLHKPADNRRSLSGHLIIVHLTIFRARHVHTDTSLGVQN